MCVYAFLFAATLRLVCFHPTIYGIFKSRNPSRNIMNIQTYELDGIESDKRKIFSMLWFFPLRRVCLHTLNLMLVLLTVSSPSRSRCENSNFCILAPLELARMHTFYHPWQMVGRDSLASTPYLNCCEEK